MICRACGQPGPGILCRGCAASLERAGERRLDCGLLVRSAFTHGGAARVLVHNLKYRGLLGAAEVLGLHLAALLPPETRCLIPVPRVMLRLWRHGIDPARGLAVAAGRHAGIPVVEALARPLWWAGRAGPAGVSRGSPVFRSRRDPPPGAVLVDDVLTTGATLAAAAACLPGVVWAVTATGPAGTVGGR